MCVCVQIFPIILETCNLMMKNNSVIMKVPVYWVVRFLYIGKMKKIFQTTHQLDFALDPWRILSQQNIGISWLIGSAWIMEGKKLWEQLLGKKGFHGKNPRNKCRNRRKTAGKMVV